jgi:hypothetical protein
MKSSRTFVEWLLSSWGTKLGSLALVVTIVVISVAAGDESESGRRRRQIEGSWWQSIEQDGGPTQALVSFAEGGVIIATANFPGSSQSSFQGTWTQTGPREFAWTSFSFVYDDAGDHIGIVRVHDELELARDGQSFSGNGKVELLDVDGTFVMELGESEVHAVRIDAE